MQYGFCFVEIVTTSQSIDELNYFPNCDTLQARQPFGNYSVLLYLCFVVIRIQNHEFQTAVYSSLALFEIYKLHIVSVSEK